MGLINCIHLISSWRCLFAKKYNFSLLMSKYYYIQNIIFMIALGTIPPLKLDSSLLHNGSVNTFLGKRTAQQRKSGLVTLTE
jgi:hypothetical protein